MTPEFETSALLQPFRHGFFARTGGCSIGDYKSLNCGLKAADSHERVTNNRKMALQALALEVNLVVGWQTHSARVAVVEDANQTESIQADGLITKNSSVAIGVLTADCQPILLADRESGVVATVHAGWRGTLNGIIENTIAAMISQGAVMHRIKAVIGPTISQKNYQVGREFREQFLTVDSASESFFSSDVHSRLTFDLPGYGLMRLQQTGIRTAEWVGRCTYAESTRYFSYRRSQHEKRDATGLQISIIAA